VGLTLVLLGALLLPACSSNNPTDPGGQAVIDISVTPNPVIGTQDPFSGSVSAAYVVNIREQGGLGGGQLQFVNSTVFDNESGLQVANSYFDSASLKVFVGTDRVEAGGELDVTQTVSYSLPDLSVAAVLSVAVQFVDDRGNLTNLSTLASIVPEPAE
jgi:hypothetical protein